MAALAPELLVPGEPGRFRADDLLGAEDWDAALYSCLDDPALLFPSLDPDPMFDCGFGGGDAASPPDPPWELEPPRLIPELQVKAEPRSPSPPQCQSPPGERERPPGMVKPEPLPPHPGKGEGPPPRAPPPIQPKPPGGAPASPPQGQTIVLQPLPAGGMAAPAVLLSPAELLLPGLLCLPPPGPPARAPPPRAEAKVIVPAPAPAAPPGPPQLDPQQLKRQQRLLRNRESAWRSRRRRREYEQGLERRLQGLERSLQGLQRSLRAALGDNERLRAENAELRTRLGQPGEQVPPPPGPRRLACVAALLLFLAFNLGPRRNASLGPVPLGGGDCPGFNRTESLRLADALSGWVRRHQIERRKPGNPPRAPPRPTVSPPRKVSSSPRLLPPDPPKPQRAPPGQLQLYGRPPIFGAPPFLGTPHVLAAIAPRADTFYVVSFRRDHLLLPATSHNKTSRPKMSLVMPAAALNETLSGRGRGLAMMQVDCEVMDTRVIRVPRPPRRSPRPLYLGTGA